MLSVVVPVRNDAERLSRCLQSLKAQTVTGFEVLVIDDGSADDSALIASRAGARVILQEKEGAAAARNRGIMDATGEVILFTDADCVCDAHWVERLSRPLLAGKDGAVGRCTSGQRHWVAALVQAELDERYACMGHHQQIDFLNTGNCGFRREILLKDPFDETFPWLEDVELSFRLASRGYRMVYVSDAVVEHPHPQSLWRYTVRKLHYASCAPEIYRRFPAKTFSDSRTPINRRLQLASLALAFPVAVLSWKIGLLLLVFSIVCGIGVVAQAFSRGPGLAILSPIMTLAGNLGFLAGTLLGIVKAVAPGRRKYHRVPTDHKTAAAQKEAASPGRELVS
ncbi:MAG: glycosyltransferase family 2 protein [Acidobacteria bacterium]|nr:MAG: glycosyltransferase family 2 protein [Acidobacteriota bacterium]